MTEPEIQSPTHTPSPAPGDGELVPFATTRNPMSAHLLAMILDGEGIDARVLDEHQAATLAAMAPPVSVHVPRSQHALAVHVLDERLREDFREHGHSLSHCIVCGYDLRGLQGREHCPECGTGFEQSTALRRNLTIVPLNEPGLSASRAGAMLGWVVLGVIIAMALGTALSIILGL